MKTRNGFVSNSSSSSFVVGLKNRPKTWEELHEILFGCMTPTEFRPEWIRPEDDLYETYFVTSHTIAQNIFNQIEDQNIVSDSLLAKICDPEKHISYKYGEDEKAITEIEKQMIKRYGIEGAYCISPTNRLWKSLCNLRWDGGKKFRAEDKRLRKKRWDKVSPRFKGLKKFVIMTQTDGGEKARVLAIMESRWNQIMKNVKNVKLTSH